MRDELIKFETAKLAKEKGFDVFCKDHYAKLRSDRKIFDFKEGEDYIRDKKGSIVLGNLDNLLYNFYDYDQYSAPTQSLLQRWLREVHNINIEIKLNFNIGYYNWQVMTIKPQNVLSNQKVVGLYSYEQALEEGLVQALKIIKI